MEDNKKTELFERVPVPDAVMRLAVPTILSSLVMVLYNLADTYFVGMLDNPVENAAVALAAPVLLAFNAVNNLFGVGSSSMMSRALGRRDYDTVYRSSAFGFYCCIICSIIFSIICTVGKNPLLGLLGADARTAASTAEYLKWTVTFGAAPAILNVVMAYLVRAEGASFHASVGTMSGCLLNIILDPLFILPRGFNMGAAGAGLATFLSNCVACLYFFILLYRKRGNTYVCIRPSMFRFKKDIVLGVFGVLVWSGCGGCDGDNTEDKYGSDADFHGTFTGNNAIDKLQLLQQKYPSDEGYAEVCDKNIDGIYGDGFGGIFFVCRKSDRDVYGK